MKPKNIPLIVASSVLLFGCNYLQVGAQGCQDNLEELLRTIERDSAEIDDELQHVFASAEIARNWAQLGHNEAVTRVLKSTDNSKPEWKQVILQQIALGYADQGDYASAVETLTNLKRTWLEVTSRDIAVQLVLSGDRKQALEVIGSLPAGKPQASALIAVAAEQQERTRPYIEFIEFVDRAQQQIDEAASKDKITLLTQLSEIVCGADRDGARELLSRAARLADEQTDFIARNYGLWNVAKSQAQCGLFDEAFKTWALIDPEATNAGNAPLTSLAMKDIALGFVRAEQLPRARQLSEKLDEKFFQAEILVAISEVQYSAGDPEGAAESLDRALDLLPMNPPILPGLSYSLNEGLQLRRICIAFAHQDQPSKAVDTITRLPEQAREAALVEVIAALIAAENLKMAATLVSRLESDEKRAASLRKLASAYCEADKLAEARLLLSPQDAPLVRVYVLLGMFEGRYNRDERVRPTPARPG